MLLDPPRLKPPPPRPPPPPPPPRPPRASTSWIMKAVMPTKALSIARLWSLPRMLLSRSFVGRHLDLLRIRVRRKGEVRVREGRVQLPLEASDEGRLGRIVPVNDHQLARERLVAILDPDFPVDVVFAKGVMVGLDPIDGGRADIIS